MKPENGLQVAQDRETPVQTGRTRAFSWRYAYARAADTRSAGDPGQDYITFRYDDTTFAFALCDGVSQSFFGELSARLLGDALLEWMWKDLPAGTDSNSIQAALASKLKALTGPAKELVKRHPIPKNLPKMLLDVLEQKRALGSESTFICGRIDLPGPDSPDGRTVMAWMGDSRLRIWGPNGERSDDLGGEFQTSQRWSTHRGAVESGPHIFINPIQHDGRVALKSFMAYSDGLSDLDGTQPPSDGELNDMIARSASTSTSDDISLLEVQIEAATMDKKAALVAPSISSVYNDGGRLKVQWAPVPDASQYRIEVRNETDQSHEWEAQETSWTSPPLKPGRYAVRVRGYRGEEPGEWSRLTNLQIAPAAASSPSHSSEATRTTNPARPAMPAAHVTVPPATTQKATSSPVSPAKVTPSTTTKTDRATTALDPKNETVSAQTSRTETVTHKRGAPSWAMIAIPLVLLALLALAAFALLGGQGGQKAAAQATASAQAATTATSQVIGAQQATAQAQSQFGTQVAVQTEQAIQAAQVATAQARQAAQATSQVSAAQEAATAAARAAQPEGEPIASFVAAIGPNNARNLQLVPGLKELDNNAITNVVFSPADSRLMAAVASDGAARFWRMSDGALVRIMRPDQSTATSLTFSPDGKTVALGLTDGTVELRNIEGGARLRTFTSTQKGAINSVVFSPDGQTLAAGSEDKLVQLWSKDGTPMLTLADHRDSVRSVAFSPDGQTLATGSADTTARLWRVSDGALLKAMTHRAAVNDVDFSPTDGKILASASDDKTLRLWNVPNGTPSGNPFPHDDAVSSVAFAPKESVLASGSRDGTVRMWNVNTGSYLDAKLAPMGPVRSVAFSSDGTILVAGGADMPTSEQDQSLQAWAVAPDTSAQATGTAKAIQAMAQANETTEAAIGATSTAFATAAAQATAQAAQAATAQAQAAQIAQATARARTVATTQATQATTAQATVTPITERTATVVPSATPTRPIPTSQPATATTTGALNSRRTPTPTPEGEE